MPLNELLTVIDCNDELQDRAKFAMPWARVTDRPIRDGTGLRDYIHVWDLALAHVRAVEAFDEVLERTGEASSIINLGLAAV